MKRTLLFYLLIVLTAYPVYGQDCDQQAVSDNVDSPNPLTDIAIYAANNVCPENTFYTWENDELEDDRGILIDLFATAPYNAYAECSGWVSYALSNTASQAYQGVFSVKEKCFKDTNNNCLTEDFIAKCDRTSGGTDTLVPGWPRAYVYYLYFKGDLRPENDDFDTYWQSGNDMGELQAGDVLAYCTGGYCSDTNEDFEAGADTGHIMIVLDAKPTELDDLKTTVIDDDNLTMFPADTKFYEVAVVDASGVNHGSDDDFKELRLQDRCFCEDLDTDTKNCNGSNEQNCDKSAANISCNPQNGGLGAGVVKVAQWGDAPDYNYAFLFHDISANKWATNDGTLKIFWGRVIQFNLIAELINEVNNVFDDNTGRQSESINSADLASREHVELTNNHGIPRDISGYTIWDRDELRHTFAAGTVLLPKQAVVVYEGAENVSQSLAGSLSFPASSGSLDLDDEGDVLIIRNAEGETLDSLMVAPADEFSQTRFPAGSDSFVSHRQFGEASPASPGTEADGTPYLSTVEFAQSEIVINEGDGDNWTTTALSDVLVINKAEPADSVVFSTSIVESATTAGIGFDSTATADVLLAGLEGTYVIKADDTQSLMLNAGIWNDDETEADKTITLSLEAGEGSLLPIGHNNILTIHLIDDDLAVTGLDNVAIAGLRIYPNPGSRSVQVETLEPAKLLLMSLSGQVIKVTESNGQAQFDLQNLQPGVYLLQIEQGTQQSVHKLLVR